MGLGWGSYTNLDEMLERMEEEIGRLKDQTKDLNKRVVILESEIEDLQFPPMEGY